MGGVARTGRERLGPLVGSWEIVTPVAQLLRLRTLYVFIGPDGRLLHLHGQRLLFSTRAAAVVAAGRLGAVVDTAGVLWTSLFPRGART
jgi:hypothetical protein